MSDGFPSMTALLGLLAVAGFQNRDKIAEMIGGLGGSAGSPPPGAAIPSGAQGGGSGAASPGHGGHLGHFLGGAPVPASVGGFLSGGLSELVNRFQQAGQGSAVNSWVGTGQNQPIEPPHLEQAIGPDVLSALEQRTGLSRAELVARLSRELPTAIDRYTPDGRLPSPA